MKARGIFVSLLIILICALMFLSGCGKSDKSLSSGKAITAYSLNGVAGTIDETRKTIAVTMPVLTNITSLAATFTTTGASVKVGTMVQASGVTTNNFTSPVAYTVTAADGSIVTYTITVVAGAWYNPASNADNISPDGQDACFLCNTQIWHKQIAMDDNGNIIIVWVQSDGTNRHILKSERRNGVWTNPANLADNIGPANARFPQVEMDNHGNTIIIWDLYFNQGANGVIEYRNGTWSTPTNLTLNGQNINPTHVAMDDNGNAIIVWPQSDGTNSQIFKSEYRDGAWHNPTNLSDNISSNTQGGNNPLVAMSNNGEAIIAYEGSDGTNSQIFKSEYR